VALPRREQSSWAEYPAGKGDLAKEILGNKNLCRAKRNRGLKVKFIQVAFV